MGPCGNASRPRLNAVHREKTSRMLRLKHFKTPLRKILAHGIRVERTQRRYSKSSRFTREVGEPSRGTERVRNIAWDYAHEVGDMIAELASEYSSIVALENLNHLRDKADGSKLFNERLSLWFCRKVRNKLRSECPKRGCGLKDNGSRVLYCPRRGYVGDRDVIARTECAQKMLKMWGAPERPPSPTSIIVASSLLALPSPGSSSNSRDVELRC